MIKTYVLSPYTGSLSESFSVKRSLPHGHVAAVFGTIKKLSLHNLIASDSSRKRALVLAMIVARILDPRSKLATAKGLNSETCFSSLSELLVLEKADEDELYEASLFDQRDLVEFSCPDYPSERLIACRNPLLVQEKSLTRVALLQATEQELNLVVTATQRDKRSLKGADQIWLRVGRVLNSKGVGKYFNVAQEESFSGASV